MKTVIITGGNSGIGYQASKQLAKLEYRVIMVCRNEKSAQKACDNIRNETTNLHVDYMIADLADSNSVKNVAENLIKSEWSIDALVNNAADFDISNKVPQFNAGNIEKQFATNVVAPFLLSELLMPKLQQVQGKIINISTQGLMVYPNISLEFDNLNAELSYKPDQVYYQNKLALLMVSLYQRRKYPQVTIHAVRVTNVKIDITKYENLSWKLKQLYRIKSFFSIQPAVMAQTYTKLIQEQYNGFLYNEKMKEVKANKAAYDMEKQEQLYKILQKIVTK